MADGRFGTLLTVAPAAVDLPQLLRIAIDAEQVGAARIHLAPDQPDTRRAVTAIREQTRLVVTADPDGVAAPAADRTGPDFTELVLPASLAGPELLVELARIARAHPGAASVGGRGPASLPVLLAALAVGLHLRVGTADADRAPTGTAPNGTAPNEPGPSDRPEPAAPAGPPRIAPAGTPRPADDIALIARAAGLARIAGRPPMPIPQARAVLGLD